MGKGEKTLCLNCLEQLELLDPESRCSHCFTLSDRDLCFKCQGHKTPLKTASAFFYNKTSSSLIKNLKFGNRTDLSRVLAAFLAFQLERLEWKKPDFLVPVPMDWVRQLHRGYNQSYLLANELQQFWGVKVTNGLKRLPGEKGQGVLGLEMRKQLSSDSFKVRRGWIEGCDICLVDDVMTTGSTLNACAEALLIAGASQVRAVTVARACY